MKDTPVLGQPKITPEELERFKRSSVKITEENYLMRKRQSRPALLNFFDYFIDKMQ
jgi:hypothetical protein